MQASHKSIVGVMYALIVAIKNGTNKFMLKTCVPEIFCVIPSDTEIKHEFEAHFISFSIQPAL